MTALVEGPLEDLGLTVPLAVLEDVEEERVVAHCVTRAITISIAQKRRIRPRII